MGPRAAASVARRGAIADGEERESDRLAPDRAAELLFNAPYAEVDWEPADEDEARAAVAHLGYLFENAPGTLREMIRGARVGAETLSIDRLQGLAEIIQNADDVGAKTVEFRIVESVLVAAHDGSPVRLRDVLGFATPWLTMKAEDVLATGRFGIGLTTMRSLSDVLEIHSGCFHMRFGDPMVSAIGAPDIAEAAGPSATVLCVPLKTGSLDTAALDEWLSRWDHSALLFCRNVQRVTVLSPEGIPVRTLGLVWSQEGQTRCLVGGAEVSVSRRHAQSADGRSWVVHATATAAPAGLRRTSKATGSTVPLAVALPRQPETGGFVYAGLPVVPVRTPVRVNAQFDPITSRRELADTDWNASMLPPLADLWVGAVTDLFREHPAVAWGVVPRSSAVPVDGGAGRAPVGHRLDALLLERARTDLAGRLLFAAAGSMHPISELAIEAERLDGLVSADEIATLARVPASLPADVRDPAGRWREVLDDWRNAGADLPAEVTVEDALRLLIEPDRSIEATVALTAAAIQSGLGLKLAELKCVVTAGGERILPPGMSSLRALVLEPSQLAQQLGIGVLLHEAYLEDDDDSAEVLTWLRKRGGFIEDGDPETVVRRLAAAARAGHQVKDPLTDAQLQGLRDAFEQIRGPDRAELGRAVGQAIRLDAFVHDRSGKRVQQSARPADAYLPRAIDREPDSFAAAADTTPNLVWLAPRYAEVLRSSLDRFTGLGAQKFLGLLGAELAPRIVPHGGLVPRFADARRGLPAGAHGSPPERARELSTVGATYTLEDLDSPDLRAVVTHIANDRKATQRRRRATALLATLGRAWRSLAAEAYVVAAADYYSWQPRGDVRAFWLWAAGAARWLDDIKGTPQRPLDLRLRTASTMAVHGADAEGYLREEFDDLGRRDVLAALGVTGDPSTRNLMDRLMELRTADPETPNLGADVALVYEAFSDRLGSGSSVPGDLTERELRAAFATSDGLVLTQLGWQPPNRVLAGPPLFGRHRAFAPQVPGAERLWTTLQIRHPSLDDCVHVLRELARQRIAPEGADRTVMLETLRLLEVRIGRIERKTPETTRRLARLTLWTTRGWTSGRPVYAVDDPTLVDGLGAKVPVWQPGGELSQFEGLLGPLRITRLSADATTVIHGDAAVTDEGATKTLRAAVALLHDDLVRNDHHTAETLRLPWEQLSSFEVRIDPELRVCVNSVLAAARVEVPVTAKADATAGVLYLSGAEVLRQIEGGGRAIAALFGADQRRIAQAWLAACIAEEDGRVAEQLALASQLAEEERKHNEAQMAERLAQFQQGTAGRHDRSRPTRPPARTPDATPAMSPPRRQHHRHHRLHAY